MRLLHGRLPFMKKPGAVSRPGAIRDFQFQDIHESSAGSNNNSLRGA